MTRTEFLAQLRQELKGLSAAEIDGIAADYAAHFDEASVSIAGSGDVRLHSHPRVLRSRVSGSGEVTELPPAVKS
jgi:hypothetical protein